MADQLFLSFWLRNYSDATMLRNYEKLLKLFPFSRLARQASTFRVMAVDPNEPVVAEVPYPPPVPVDAVVAIAKDFQNPDSSYRLETWWDLWQVDPEQPGGDWKVAPAKVALCCFGPDFDQTPSAGLSTRRTSVIASPGEDSAIGCALEIEFGIDAHFLPQPDAPESTRMIESNIKSLLKLVHDLDDALPVDTRRLWSESGENFAEKLQHALSAVAE